MLNWNTQQPTSITPHADSPDHTHLPKRRSAAKDASALQALRVLVGDLGTAYLRDLVGEFGLHGRPGPTWAAVRDLARLELDDRRRAFAEAREEAATKRAETLNPQSLNPKAASHFIVQASHRRVSSTEFAWRLAVLEVDPGLKRVSMISPHARGCRRVIAVWERLNEGVNHRDTISRAQGLAAKLNEGRPLATCLLDHDADLNLPTLAELARASRAYLDAPDDHALWVPLSPAEIRARARGVTGPIRSAEAA